MDDDPRPFGFWTATAYVVGGVIGAGIFVLPSQLAPFGWTSIAAWVLGGTGAVVIAIVLAAVAEARPEQPGLMAVIGEALGPLCGVVVGWSAWVSYWTACAYISLASVRYASTFWPPVGATPFRQALAAAALLALLSLLNLYKLKTSGRFQVLTTMLKLLPLLAVMGIGALLALTDPGAFARQAHPAFAAGDLLGATTLAMAAIIGFESASLAAQRVRNPRRNIPRATILGVIVTGGIYVAVCTTIVFTVPQAQLAAAQAPVADFVGRYWGPAGALGVAAFAVVSTVGCLSVWVLMQGEVPLAMVRAGMLPDWLARTNRHDIAYLPLLTASGLGMAILILTGWSNGEKIMDFMLRLTAVSGVWIYAFACIAALVLRVKVPIALLGLGFVAAIFVGGGLEPFVLSIALSLTCLPLYWLTRRAMITNAGSSAAGAGHPG